MSSPAEGIARIARLAKQAETRIRFARALRSGARALCAALLVATIVLALRKLGVVAELPARILLVASALSVAIAAGAAWTWRLPERAGARVLDRFHGLHDRLASALSFASAPPADRTPFMRAAIDDAIAAAPAAHPRKAVPIVFPRELGAALAIGGVLALVGVLEVRTRRPVASARLIDPLEMSQDDLDDVKDFLKQIEQKDSADDTKATIEEFNRLVADIADKRLDRNEAFRRMQELEEKLITQSANDKQALERDLEAMGESLKKAELTRPAGLALGHDDLAKARDAFRELAQKMRNNQAAPVDKAKLDQLREAVKEAAQQAEKNRSELERRREQLADDILKMKEHASDGGSEEEESLLKKKQEELERLDRDLDPQRNAERQLDRLDRELEQAAEDLMKDMGLSADDLEQGAEDLNRMEEQQMSQQEKEELKQKLDELRQLLRQQGQGGKGQIVRLQRFGRAAHGQGQSGSGGGQGQEGQGQGQGQGQNQGQGNGGDPSGQGQGQQGQGAGASQGSGQGGETWILGPNGEKLLMLSRGQGQSGQGSGQGQGGQGPEGPGHWGTEHDPNVQGKATNPKMGTQDTQVQGADAQGGSRSQVILGAAQRGFSSKGYRKVYTEYHQVAEESLGKDDIPGGYRFYVKRYFQLIRPRETP